MPRSLLVRIALALGLLVSFIGSAPLASPRQTATSVCPPSGRSHTGAPAHDSDEAMRNRRKRTVPTGTPASARLLALDDFKSLQEQVDRLFPGEERAVFHGNRDALKNLSLGDTPISEGDLVRVVGFLTAARAEGAESVNCESRTSVDFHINVGPTKEATEFEGVVVEIIPQHRPIGLKTRKSLEEALASIVKQKFQVMVVGQLMLDNEHLVNGDPANPRGENPKRISVWEIHPVTTLLVCRRAACDPEQIAQWTPLQRPKTS